MQKFASAFVAAAVLVSAGSASASSYRIPFGDLSLSDPAGAQALDQRITRTARNACRVFSGLDAAYCVRVFRDEAMRNLPPRTREEYVRARKGQRI